MRSINRLNEEIARWAFEILFRNNSPWKIAFTNPTAGPWKTIKATSKINGIEGEVYRFILEEDRPDIIMVNDTLETVIIFEAKDSLTKLIDKTQAKKSAEVVVKLSSILHSKGDNDYWRGREKYKVILGLLWGSTDFPENNTAKNRLFDYYHSLVANNRVVYSDLIVGIETLYCSRNLQCKAYYKCYNEDSSSFGSQIVSSLVAQ